MKKNRLFLIGVFNGIVFTFAFLIFLAGMDEEFHFLDSEESIGVDSIVYMDLSSYNIEDIETEYFKRQGPENILDILLHQNSMAGTIWENKWDSISDLEKVGILLNDTEIADRLNHKKKRKKIRRNPLTRNQKIEQLEDSLRIMRTKLEVYEQTVKWFRNADIDELQRGIEEIRNMPKEVPLQ